MPRGRPTDYSPKLGLKICTLYAEGVSLREIEAMDGMPTKTTIVAWALSNKEFSAQYARAQEIRTELDADEIKGIADDGRNDWMKRHDKDGAWVENGEAVRRSQLRVDTRKWLMARRLPKKYGDRLENILTGVDGEPVQHSIQITFVQPLDQPIERATEWSEKAIEGTAQKAVSALPSPDLEFVLPQPAEEEKAAERSREAAGKSGTSDGWMQ